MEQQAFADGLGSILVVGGTVRLEFTAFLPGEANAKGQPQTAVAHRLVMPLPGFMMAAQKIQETMAAIGKMQQQQGVPAAPVASEAAPEPAPQAPSKPRFP